MVGPQVERGMVGPQVERDMVSRTCYSGANVVSHIDGDSDIAPVCCWGWAQKRNNGICQHFYLAERCLSSSGPDARQFSPSLYDPGVPSEAAAPVSEVRVSLSKFMCRSFKRTSWDSRSFPSHSVTLPTSFYS